MKILIAEPISPVGYQNLAAHPGWQVIQADPKTYQEHLADCEALIVRSAVKVNRELIRNAPKLRVVGRAGVGVDNVDLPAATNAGILVMNTPGGNAVSVAEHTIGLMLAMARSIPAASESTKSGKWEKRRFLGQELRDKTLGVAGLGSIGREVVLRARGFGMRIIGTDPYVSSQQAEDLGVTLVDLNELLTTADYLTLHVALTPETNKMINRESIARMRDGARIVNCARGELVDMDGLLWGLESGKLAGAALDVFDPEPLPADHPLLQQPALIATPHIGGSTEEAQEIVGVRIADQVAEYLTNGVAINAVNMPALSPEQYRALGPYITLAERLGSFVSYISDSNPVTVRFTYSGRAADLNTTLVRNAGLSGLLARSLASKANLINAMQIAADRGLNISEHHMSRTGHTDSIRIEVETAAGTTSVEGAMVLDRPRLLSVDGIYVEAPLEGNLLYLKNLDVPGVIGYVGTVMGKNGINIANFSLGREDKASHEGAVRATAIVACDGTVPDHVIAQLLENPSIRQARNVEFL
ncbi:MAG: phosphoglycerate dehydrogenase [Bryobacter sp.]|nr:phosphoglycerate dehydrogenase [Bryobacter sp.]